MKCLQKIKEYVPRHIRLGVCAMAPRLEIMHDVVETVPVVDKSGSVVRSENVIKQVPVSETMKKYKCSAFRLSALIKAGVPLEMVNVNHSNAVTIDKLEAICKNIDSADVYVQKVMQQQKERESWFSAPDVESNNESNN